MKYIRVKYRDAQNKKKLFICAKIMDTHDMENDEFFAMYRDVSDEQLIDPPWILPKLGENALDRLYGSEEKGDEAHRLPIWNKPCIRRVKSVVTGTEMRRNMGQTPLCVCPFPFERVRVEWYTGHDDVK